MKWLAEDLYLDRRLVALKALKARSRSTAEERQRAITPLPGRERLYAVWSRRPLALRVEQLRSLVLPRAADSGMSRPYVATRDMKLVQQSVWLLEPGEWQIATLELDHHP